MILRKYMSLLGVGSARVDLLLEKEEYVPGEPITGYFFIKGGTIEQLIKKIECDLVQTDIENDNEEIIDSIIIVTKRMIESEEDNRINFSFLLPTHLPVSTKQLSYRFKTRLIFDEGVTSVDQDSIVIVDP
jgi:sporulation-control protein